MDAQVTELQDCARSLPETSNIVQTLEAVNQARITLMGIDLRLEDCQALLVSYQSTLAELSAEEIQQGATE